MHCLNNSFDYNARLLGLLPYGFNFAKDEHVGVKFQTKYLKKVKKPSEDHHDGDVIISDTKLLHDTAIVERKVVRYQTSTCHTDSESSESSESESDSDEEPTKSVDPIMKEEASAMFLYKSFSDTNGQQPDFLSYRLPLMFLAIKTDPYFFKVKKIQFKPYGCEKEMEFIQIHWPIELDELYQKPHNKFNPSGWSGPMFNKWATRDFVHETSLSHQEPDISPSTSEAKSSDSDVPPIASAAKASSSDADARIDSIEADSSSCTYHWAFIEAKIKPKNDRSRHDFSDSSKEFNVLMTALVGGVWELEKNVENYTCKHLAETRTVKEETLREKPYIRHSSKDAFYYKRIRMLTNYWQCYLAGEEQYLVGVNGPISDGTDAMSAEDKTKKRTIKELRLYNVSMVPGFVKKCGAQQGFRPWSKEILENRLYKSLCVIYDKIVDAPVGKEFMFVKYNEYDPPVHDVDDSITIPYLLAFRQVIIEEVPTQAKLNFVKKLMWVSGYSDGLKRFEKRELTDEDIPKMEEKGNCRILTFTREFLAEMFLCQVGAFLRYLKKFDKYPVGAGLENVSVRKATMEKPVPPRSPSNQSWRSSNQQHHQSNQYHSDRIQDHTQSINQQSNPQNNNCSWRRTDLPSDSSQSWRSSNPQQQQWNSWNNNRRQDDTLLSWRSTPNQHRQETNRRNDDRRGPTYSRQSQVSSSKSNPSDNWRRK